jgi:hypothetical protein
MFRRNSGTDDTGSLILELLKIQNQWIIIISNNCTTLIKILIASVLYED